MVRCINWGIGNIAVSINVAHKGNTIVSNSCSGKRLLRCEPTAAGKRLAWDGARAGTERLMKT